MKDSDISAVVKLINCQNEKLDFSPRYSTDLLKNCIKKYHAEGIVAEDDKSIIGVILLFLAPWSGWMYRKPVYSDSYGILLMKHPLEFAINPNYLNSCGPHLLFEAMQQPKNKGFLFIADIFDQRVSWIKNAFLSVGADEHEFDYGTVFVKNIIEKKIEFKRPIYIPTNLIIDPYASKDY
jgi:hypothetical protein